MAETVSKRKAKFDLRAKVPFYLRAISLVLLAAAVIAVGIGLYRNSGQTEFRMKGFPASLSKDVVAVVNGYERVEAEGDQIKYSITADRATTFSDEHQELENVDLKVYQTGTSVPDRITSRKAIYLPGAEKDFTVFFAGDVEVETQDGLAISTDNITYRRAAETAEAEEHIAFSRENLKGSSFGAIVRIAEKKIELLRDFRLEAHPEAAGQPSSVVTSGYAYYDQQEERIDLSNGVHIVSNSSAAGGAAQNTDIRAARATVSLVVNGEKSRDVGKAELFERVAIESIRHGQPPVNINSQYALFERIQDRFELGGDVHILVKRAEGPTNLRARSAVYEQAKGNVWLVGGAEITQPADLLKGENIHATLFPDRNLKRVSTKGNAYLKRSSPERAVEISGNEMEAEFGPGRNIISANVLGSTRAVMVPANVTEYTRVTLTAPKALRVGFKGAGVIDQINTDGRTTIALDSPNNAPSSSNKKVTADTVRVLYAADGGNIRKAEAIGNAKLEIDPLTPAADNFRTVVNAPRFDCEFFPAGNNARNCEASTKTKMVRTPSVRREGRGTQTVTSDRMNVFFNERSRDIERLEANGNAKFAELDRNASAGRFVLTQADQVIRLRGGEPLAWDSRARVRANEIDWDTRNRRSAFRGRVSTTYYSQKQTSGATPFMNTEKPVFLTSDTADIDHGTEVAVYQGNARAWQDNNYVRADTFTIRQKEGQMLAEGNVQSILYDAKNIGERQGSTPVHAAARRMSFNREQRLLRYDGGVDIRQGTDRLLGAVANIHLSPKNEVTRTVLEQDVVITRPGRKATGDFAQYMAEDEVVILRGSPARVEDSARGFSEGAELTVFLNEGRVVGEGRSKGNPAGRTRSVYRVQE